MRRSDRGAAAVEMALVLPILVLLLLSIVDYGVWYSDSLAVRQGTREAARMAVVSNFTGATGSSAADKTADLVKKRAGTLNATIYVKVSVNGGGAWEENQQLTVCTIAKEGGLAGFAPLPANGQLRSKVVMRVESTIAGDSSTHDDSTAEVSFSWC